MDVAISVVNGHFTWDAPPPASASGKKKGGKKRAPTKAEDEKEQEKIFTLRDINLEIAKGQLTAIVGEFRGQRVFAVSDAKHWTRRPSWYRQDLLVGSHHRRDA